MSTWKNIKKSSIGWIKGYAQKVGGITNSTDSGHFTPQNSSYWIFVGVFFLCIAAFVFKPNLMFLGSKYNSVKACISNLSLAIMAGKLLNNNAK